MATLNSKLKVAVFISGRGSNLKALIKSSKLKKSKYKLALYYLINQMQKD